MPTAISPLMMRMLETLFGYRPPAALIEDNSPDFQSSYEVDYAHRAGYRVGANGEWIARHQGSSTNPDQRP